MLVPKPLRAASGPCGSDIGQGAMRRRCCPRVPGSPSLPAPAGSSAPAPPPPPHEAEMRKGGVCTEGPGTPEPGPAPSLPLGRSRFSPRRALSPTHTAALSCLICLCSRRHSLYFSKKQAFLASTCAFSRATSCTNLASPAAGSLLGCGGDRAGLEPDRVAAALAPGEGRRKPGALYAGSRPMVNATQPAALRTGTGRKKTEGAHSCPTRANLRMATD